LSDHSPYQSSAQKGSHTITEILPSLFFVHRGFLNGNHFVYRSDRPVLIDTAYLAHFDRTRQLIADLGADVSRTALIVSTHTHCDHIGGNRRIQELSGCGIALHTIGRHFIEARDDWSTWWRYYDQEAEFFRCTHSLEDGETLAVGPHEFRVIHTPGHAADGIVLYHAREKVLISADALWERDMPVITLRVEGSRALFDCLDSLEKIRRLDVRLVCPGHGRPFAEMPEAVARWEKRIHGYLERRESLGDDQLKRIIVYTLLMRPGRENASFFDHLMNTVWFPETCAFFFNGEHRRKFDEVMAGLIRRRIVTSMDGKLFTQVAA
jgi:hydroxyacylglutathione hydrolase